MTSSVIAGFSLPNLAGYSATKAMVSNFAQALHYEVKHHIDVTAWEPGPCSTSLFDASGTPPPTTIAMTPQKAVRGILCQIGRARISVGNYYFYIVVSAMGMGKGLLSCFGGKVANEGRKDFFQR